MSCSEALSKIQKELNVPKGRRNTFGNYMYRNAEDIVEAVKKIMPDGAILTITDNIMFIGDRHYVEAIANFSYENQIVSTRGYAREPLNKKGSDESQITGAASSYARKYALNGLFLIDDGKDADSQEHQEPEKPVVSPHTMLANRLLAKGATKEHVQAVLDSYFCSKLAELPLDKFEEFYEKAVGANSNAV